MCADVFGSPPDHEQLAHWRFQWFVLRSFHVRRDVERLVHLSGWKILPPPVSSDQPLDMPLGWLPVSLVGVLLVAPLPSPQLDDLDLASWPERRVLSLHAAPRRATRRSADGNRDALLHEAQTARHEPHEDRAHDGVDLGLVRAVFRVVPLASAR